jgi:hypothetical protein
MPRIRLSTLTSSLVLVFVAGCATSTHAPAAAAGQPAAACQAFAQPFVLVAEQRDGGKSKQAQLTDVLMINSDNLSPEDQAAEQVTLHWTKVAIELAYSRRELSPQDIRKYVLTHCSVDADGKPLYDGD